MNQAFLLVVCAGSWLLNAVEPVAGIPWGWNQPRETANTVIFTAEPGKLVQEANVRLLPNGSLLLMFMHSNYVSDAVVHDVRIEWFTSSDGGSTWQRTSADSSAFAPPVNELPRPALRRADGALLATGSRGWENFPDTPEKRQELSTQGYYVFTHEDGNAPGTISIIRRAWMQRSYDDGKSWKLEDIPLPTFMPHFACYGDPILLRSGAYLQPMWGRFDLKQEPKLVSSLVLRTEDGGGHWEVQTIAKATEFDFNETSLTQAANGSVVALMRTSGQRELWGAVSTDDGKTWSPPFDTGLRGSTPCLVTSKDGLVVAVYCRRGGTPGAGEFTSTGVYACVSRDHGRTWDAAHQVPLVDTGKEIVNGYPGAVALPDGSVYAVYSFHGASQVGGTRFHPLSLAFGGGASAR